MNKRDLRLDDYNISKYAYRELSNFCLQYPEKKQRLRELHNPEYILKPQNFDDRGHSSDISDTTASTAIITARLSTDCEMIEQAAIEADSGIYQYILLSVTQGISYRYLRECSINGLGRMPAGKEYFNIRRRRFFYLLAKKKGVI